MKVRIATPGDEENLMALCRDLHAENALLAMNEERVKETLRLALERKRGVIGVIGLPGSRLEGAIVLIFGQLWYSDQWCIEELFSYVPPAFRRSDNAKALIDYSTNVADEMKMPLLIGILSNARTEAKVRLYQRKLGKPVGAYFLYGGKTGEQSHVRL